MKVIKPDLTTKEAYALVKVIKEGSDYSGMLVMKSLASTLRYVNYKKSSYKWLTPERNE
jgi:hypothetical protein